MIPNGGADLTSITASVRPSRTYALRFDGEGEGRLCGSTDGAEALRQAIFLRLSTERGKYLMYSAAYGVSLGDLLGKPVSLAIPEIRYRIEEALLQDDRIESVSDFDFQADKGKVTCFFTVNSRFGQIRAEKEVTV